MQTIRTSMRCILSVEKRTIRDISFQRSQAGYLRKMKTPGLSRLAVLRLTTRLQVEANVSVLKGLQRTTENERENIDTYIKSEVVHTSTPSATAQMDFVQITCGIILRENLSRCTSG